MAFAHVRAGYEPEPADQARAQIRDDVTVEVFQHQDVELRGTADQLHAGVVDDQLLVLDPRVA